MTEPCDLTAVEARRLIGAKKLSPVELVESCLKRTKLVNHAINAVVAQDEKLARKTAKEQAREMTETVDGLPLLFGLPVGIKDLDDVEGLRTTKGSLVHKDNVPRADAPMVADVRMNGAIIYAKTNTPEFGAGANTRNRVYGATGNPFNPVLTAAGSSGGSAAALAVGMMPLATGSDYGGSLRTPSAFCGIVGFRPSIGVIPSPERSAGLIPWSVLGPMGRTVADAYLLFRAQVGSDQADPYSVECGEPEPLEPADLASVRAAISADMGQCPVSKAIRKTFARKSKMFARDIGAAEQAHPDFSGIHEIFEVHRGLTFVTKYQDVVAKHRDLLDRNVIDNTERGMKLTASEIGRGFVEQHKLMKRVLDFFDGFDVLITPTASVSPFPHAQLFVEEIDGEKMPTYMRWLALAYAPTMALCCSCAIPCGRDDSGMPFGIQIIGPRGSDLKVLAIAAALEQAMAGDPETARPVPDLEKLAKAPRLA